MRAERRYSTLKASTHSPERRMLSCKRIKDSVSETVYFLLCTVYEDDGDLEHGSYFDVEISDGLSAWAKKGWCVSFNPTWALITRA